MQVDNTMVKGKAREFFKRIVSISRSIEDGETQLRMRYANELTWLLIPLWVVFRVVFDHVPNVKPPWAIAFPWITFVLGAVVALGCLVASRSKYYRIELWVLALYPLVRLVSAAILGSSYGHAYYVILGVMILAPIEGIRTAILGMLSVGVLLLLPPQNPGPGEQSLLFVIWFFVLATPIMAAGGRFQRLMRKLASETVRQSEERFRILFDTFFDGLAVLDGELIVEVNSGMAKMFGRPVQELIGQPINDFFHQDSAEEDVSTSRTGKFFRMMAIRKNGEEFPAELVLKTQHTDGKTFQLLAIRDITKEHLAEIQAAEFADEMAILSSATMTFNGIEDEEELYARLGTYLHQLDSSARGVITSREAGRDRMHICGGFGFSKGEDRFLIGLEGAPYGLEQLLNDSMLSGLASGRLYEVDVDDAELQFPDVSEEIRRRFYRELKIGKCYCIGMARAGEILGSVLLFSDHESGLKRSGMISTLVHQASLSLQRLRAERELQQERDLLHLLMENIPDGIYFKDKAACYTRLNAAQASLLGADNLEDILGKTDEDTIAPGYTRHHEMNEDEVLIGGRPLIDGLERITDPYGGVRWLSTTKVPILNQRREVEGLVGISRDITARHEVELQLARNTEDLKRSNEELQHFAYIASHDLQEPLRMISSYLQLLERRCGDSLDEDGRTFIHFAVDGAKRLQGLINGLLTYSRVETRGQEMQSVDLNEVLEDTQHQLSLLLEERSVNLMSEQLPLVNGDRLQLLQVFQNLIGNAVKFNEHPSPRVEITAREEDGFWVLGIKDDGIGIDEENVDRIFKIFQRLHSREEYPGTGIGLAVCKKILERHGGEIWVESQPGQGSTFSFRLPMTSREDA